METTPAYIDIDQNISLSRLYNDCLYPETDATMIAIQEWILSTEN